MNLLAQKIYMGEGLHEEIKTSEIVDNTIKNNQQEMTIEDVLKQELPDDIIKQQLFLEIFNQPIFANLPSQSTNNELSKANIIEYIKSWTLLWNSRNIKKLSNIEEKIQFTIEDMDNYFKLTTWSLKEIKTYNNILDAEVQNKDAEVQNKDQKIEQWSTILESRKATKESYDKLDKTKYPEPTAEEISKWKGKISPKIQKTIEEKWLNTDEYAKFLVFEKKYEKDLKKNWDEEFLNNFKEFKEKIGETIPLSKTINTNTTDTLIDNNESLHNYVDNSDALKDIELPLSKELTYDDEELETYIDLIPDRETRKNIEKNKEKIFEHAKNIKENTANENDKEISAIYQQYTTEIGNIKNEISDSTQNTLQKRILGSCISWLASYFDSTTIDKKTNFADDFDVNTQEGFSIEDDVLAIKGNIDGNEIGFNYDMTEWENSNLQTDEFLNYDKVSNNFTLGADTGRKNDLGIKMPTLSYMRTIAENFWKNNFQEIIKKSNDIEDFKDTFKQKLSKELTKQFWQKTLVETRVKRDIQKNITTKTLQSTFIPDVMMAKLHEKQNINTTEQTPRAMLNIWQHTTENMRSDELERLNTLTKRFDNVTKNLANNNGLENQWKQLFEKINTEQEGETENRGENTLAFFQKISTNDEINVEDLELLINILEKDEASIGENISRFSLEFREKFTEEIDQASADQLLNNDARNNTIA